MGAKQQLSGVLAIMALIFSSSTLFAQVKIGDNPTTINAGSVMELESTNKGLLMPRISLTNTTTWGLLGTAAAGMHVYNTNAGITSTNTNYPTLTSQTGEYYWDGTGWVAIQATTTFNGFGTRSITGTQTLPNNTTNIIIFTGEDWDKGNVFTPSTGQFTVKQAGQYIITGSILTGSAILLTGQNIQAFKNNTLFFTGGNTSNILAFSPYGLVLTFVADLAVGDVVDLRGTVFGAASSVIYANFSAARLN
jgi:hypothetical protein